jgi:hypothetical protein
MQLLQRNLTAPSRQQGFTRRDGPVPAGLRRQADSSDGGQTGVRLQLAYPRCRPRLVGRLPRRLLHRSARPGRDEGNAAFLPRALASGLVELHSALRSRVRRLTSGSPRRRTRRSPDPRFGCHRDVRRAVRAPHSGHARRYFSVRILSARMSLR